MILGKLRIKGVYFGKWQEDQVCTCKEEKNSSKVGFTAVQYII